MEQKVKRLSVDLSDELHHEIKTLALKRNITMRKWVYRAIMKEVAQEEKRERLVDEDKKGEMQGL